MLKTVKDFFSSHPQESVLYINDNIEKLRKLSGDFNRHAEVISYVYQSLLTSDDIAYIADIETYEVIWVNKKMIELFGPDQIGEKCYAVFQDFKAPCPFCTNNKIMNGDAYSWIFYNEKIHRKFLIKDRMINWGKKQVRMETAIDITDLELWQ